MASPSQEHVFLCCVVKEGWTPSGAGMVVLGALIQLPKVIGHRESAQFRQSAGQSGQELEWGSMYHGPVVQCCSEEV